MQSLTDLIITGNSHTVLDSLNGYTSVCVSALSGKEGVLEVFTLTDTAAVSPSPSKKNLCIIPYKNPDKGLPKPLFYEVTREAEERYVIPGHTPAPITMRTSATKMDYFKKVIALKQHIHQGNVYEINFCIELYAENVWINPLDVYLKLHALSQAPYSLLVKAGDEFIISASPELFLKKEGTRLYTKPIKGTAPRGKNAEEDARAKRELHQSIKERTENVMAVDVARNDLSIIAQRGTVEVNRLYNIETYQTVHQMVSTVSCDLKPGIKFHEIIKATFPMASMTGAPKQSAMNLIEEYEDFERKYYSGAMGMIKADGDFELSVIIRSIFYNQKTKRLSIAVGSAITHLSDPAAEYAECLLKAGALLQALNARVEED